MLEDVVEVEAVGEHRLRLKFENGVEGEVNVAALVPFEGVFAPLRAPAVFATVRVDRELGTVCWPNGADLDPDVLHALVTGQPIPDLTRRPVIPQRSKRRFGTSRRARRASSPGESRIGSRSRSRSSSPSAIASASGELRKKSSMLSRGSVRRL